MNLPKTPKVIPNDTPLADLEKIKVGWIELAASTHVPADLFEIGYWLGKDIDTLYDGLFRCLNIGDIQVYTHISVTCRNIVANAWNTKRTVDVYKDVYHVLSWTWHYTTQASVDEVMPADSATGNDLLYVPGAWVSKVYEYGPQAEKKHAEYNAASAQAKRDELATKLLVGKDI